MPIQPGRHLWPYEILSAIGAGGMGEVYKARDTRLDRIVAIKVLPLHLADRAELRERFEREARTIASLNHPHICVLYDIKMWQQMASSRPLFTIWTKFRSCLCGDWLRARRRRVPNAGQSPCNWS